MNERPNSHYVGKDSELTPALRKCYSTLKHFKPKPEGPQAAQQPEGVSEDTWRRCKRDAEHCAELQRDKDYRVIVEDGKSKVGETRVLRTRPTHSLDLHRAHLLAFPLSLYITFMKPHETA